VKAAMNYWGAGSIAVAAPLYGGVLAPTAGARVSEDAATHFADVTSYAHAPLWFARVARQLSDFAALEHGWDSYSSPPLTSQAHASALLLLRILSEYAVDSPHLAPVSGGGMQFGWYYDVERLELEVLPDGSVEYLKVYEDGSMDDGVVVQGHLDELRDHFARLAP
jgi:hypothetical protein